MMILATYKDVPRSIDCDHDENGRVAEVFTDRRTFNYRTWNPCTEPKILINFQLGKGTYRELKSKLQDMAIDWSNLQSDLYGLSSMEIFTIECWFRKNGKRYGLLREFEEECIC